MTYGYVRVSTKEQIVDRQLIAMKAAGVANVLIDKASGKDFDRPQYKKLRKKLKRGDLLVIQSLDRFGRSYDDIIDEWRYLVKTVGVDVKVLDMPLLDTRQGEGLIGKFVSDIVLQILSFVAETERRKIKERQAQGIAAAKARGVRKCEWCGKEFSPKHSNARFCSQSCCHASSYNQRKGAAVSARNRAESDENSIARVQAYLSLPTEERYARRDTLTAKERILARDMWLRMKSPFAAYERRYA